MHRGVSSCMFRMLVSLLLPMALASSAAAEFQQQGATLLGTGAVGSSLQGSSVAMSADGNTALVGGSGDNANVGAVWIFTRSGATWTQQGAKLVGTGAAGNANQGSAVAVSADGNTAIVGGAGDNNNVGAVWIFTRNGSTWTQQGAKLVGTGATGGAQQGTSVALSADGNTAVVGGHGDDTNVGAVWIFTRSGGVWTQQGAKLVGTGAVGSANQGRSVAVSADGNTALVGGNGDNGNVGAVWVYTRSGNVWTQRGAKLVGTSSGVGSNQGVSVAMSADGKTAVVGGDGEGANGAVWVFTRSGDVWSQQGGMLVGTGGLGAHQGGAVAMSANGNTAAVGGSGDATNVGAVWIFTRSGGVWTQQGAKLVGNGATGNAEQGTSVALSADGNTLLSGGSGDNASAGAAWVFVNPAPKIVSVTDVPNDQGGKVHVLWNASLFDVAPSYGISSYTLWRRITTATAARAVSLGARLVHDGSGEPGAIRMTAEGTQSVFWEFVQTVPARGVSGYGYMAPTTHDSLPGTISAQQGPSVSGSGATGNALQGISAAVSGDGNTMIVGGPADDDYVGAVWIFTRSGGVWSQQGAKLVGTGASGPAQQGWSVALSSDGNTALVGGNTDANGVGAVWIFTRSGGVWTQQGAKLVGTGASGTVPPHQGYSVALSADGNTAAVGANGDDFGMGAVWVFTRSGSTWSQQAKLVGTGATGGAGQGISVALSADGNTLLSGGFADNAALGAVWVFTRSGTVWTQQGAKLVGTGAAGAAYQGIAVALSADGNTALVGGDQDDSQLGAVWVFVRSGNVWTQQGSKLVGSGAVSPTRQGVSVDLSADGNTAIVGGDFDNYHVGATWIFTRSGANWTQQGAKLIATDAVGPSQQGTAVSLSADGKTAVVSGPYDDGAAGAAWVYTPSTPWNVFFVDADDATSSAFYVSAADSGYSVDNLPPGPPAGTAAAYLDGAANLHWSPNLEGDFSAYRVYRGSSASFVPGPGNRVATVPDTGYADVGPAGGYYKISAVDVHGNESAFTSITPAQTTGAPGPGPLAFALERVRPNPASVRDLTVVFTLTTRAAARLELFDVAGRSVVVREVGALGPGSHAVNLAERARLRPGLLFVRLTQGGNERVTRVTVLE